MNEIKSLIDDAMGDIVVNEEAMEQFVSKRIIIYKRRRRGSKSFGGNKDRYICFCAFSNIFSSGIYRDK